MTDMYTCKFNGTEKYGLRGLPRQYSTFSYGSAEHVAEKYLGDELNAKLCDGDEPRLETAYEVHVLNDHGDECVFTVYPQIHYSGGMAEKVSGQDF